MKVALAAFVTWVALLLAGVLFESEDLVRVAMGIVILLVMGSLVAGFILMWMWAFA